MSSDSDFEIAFCESILRRDPRNLTVMELLAGLLTKVGRIDEGLRLDQRIVELDPDNPVSHYNLACSLALKNRAADAVEALRTALVLGYDDYDWLMEDPDLTVLHPYPPFSSLISEFKAGNP